MWVQSLGQEDPLEKGMTTHSNILAQRIPQTEEPGGIQCIGSQTVRHNGSDLARRHFPKIIRNFFLRFNALFKKTKIRKQKAKKTPTGGQYILPLFFKNNTSLIHFCEIPTRHILSDLNLFFTKNHVVLSGYLCTKGEEFGTFKQTFIHQFT